MSEERRSLSGSGSGSGRVIRLPLRKGQRQDSSSGHLSSNSAGSSRRSSDPISKVNHLEYIRRLDDSLTANKLRFSSLGLLGRETELKTLQESLERCCSGDGTRELVFLHGLSGTGKTSIAKHFVETNNKSSRRWMKPGLGKFDFLVRDDNPLSGFIDAFSSLCSQLQETLTVHQKASTDFRASLLSSFSEEDEIPLLLATIPILQQFLDGTGNTNESNTSIYDNTASTIPSASAESKDISQKVYGVGGGGGGGIGGEDINAEANSQRIKNIFRKLVRILSNHFAPFCIILDDLQWADMASLDLLETLMNDQENSKILFIACYRSDEVNIGSNDDDDIHPVHRLRSNLTERRYRGSNITDIEIGNLSLQHTHSVINTLLCMDDEPAETLELAQICHRRTDGNVFFLLQFLIMLKEEALLEFKLGLYKWKWDLTVIESETAATANVVGMVTERLVSKLPSQLLSLLQLAACLGSSFLDRTLSLVWEHVSKDDDTEVSEDGALDQQLEDFRSVVDLAEQNNFLEKDAVRKDPSHRWLHDNIQEAAMGSITPSSRIDTLKCRVGMVLMRHSTAEDLNREIFVVANLLSVYKPNIDEGETPSTAFEVVELFLRAAEKASSVAAFQSAFRYSKHGIALLPPDCWEYCFDETLRLFSIAAEASNYLGHIDEMLEYSATVLDQPKCSIFDKLRVYFVKLESLQQNGKSFEAVDLGLQILRSLGCSFPKSTAGQAVQTIRVLRKWKRKPPTEAQLRRLSPMTDRKTKEIIKIIFRLEASFYYTKQIFLYALASARTVQLVVDKGLCDYSAGAFLAVGNILAAVNGNLSFLRQYCDLSVLMTQLVSSGHHESRAIFATDCGYMWSKPSANIPKNLLRGYKIGMRVGDTESACWCCCHYVYFEFMAARSLAELEERCHLYISMMVELNRNEAALVAAPIWGLIFELIGSPDLISKELPPEACGSPHIAIEEVIGTITQTSPVAPYFSRVCENILHAYRREYIIGAELAIKRGNEFLSNFPHQPMGIWDTYLRGLCLYAAAKETGKRKYRRHAKKVLSTIEKWVSQGNVNARCHTSLLQAEDFSLKKKYKEAQQSYESAIVASSRGGLIHDAAIANERYALCLLGDLNDTESARYHFDAAERLYKEWGATGIAQGLEKYKTPASR